MYQKTQKSDQRGVVSFMVTLIMMLVISLIVIGFTQVTMRSRREALDRQLSSQAFYAAESGFNTAIQKIKLAQVAGTPILEKAACADDGNYDGFQLDGSNVAVTCIMVNTRPENIRVFATQDSSNIVHIESVKSNGTPSNLTVLTFGWAAPEGADTDLAKCGGSVGEFDTGDSNSCGFGMLRVDLMIPGGLGSLDPDALASKTGTFYFQPKAAATAKAIDTSDIGKSYIVGAGCSTASKMCHASLTLNGLYQTKELYARLSTLYRDAPTVLIDGDNNGAAGSAFFSGAQAVIDVTGRAQDVLRRVQVRYSLNAGDETPPWAVAGRVCKRLIVVPAPYAVANDAMCN